MCVATALGGCGELRGGSIASNRQISGESIANVKRIKEQYPHAYIGFWFTNGVGMRQREVQRMRWEYLVDRQDGTWVSGGAGKDGRRIDVPMQARAVEGLADFRK